MAIVVTGTFRWDPEIVAGARDAIAHLISETLKEEGCRAYAFSQNALEPDLYHVTEVWESQENLNAHMTAPHIKAWLDNPASQVRTDRKVTIFETSSEKTL